MIFLDANLTTRKEKCFENDPKCQYILVHYRKLGKFNDAKLHDSVWRHISATPTLPVTRIWYHTHTQTQMAVNFNNCSMTEAILTHH